MSLHGLKKSIIHGAILYTETSQLPQRIGKSTTINEMPSESNSHKLAGFDPFKNRLCRDVRNKLSESLIKSIHNMDIGPSYAVAEQYSSKDVEQLVKNYINDRITRYKTIINQIRSADIEIHETYLIAVLIWDQELFFEVHEWLEKKWHSSKGTEKIIAQSLIRAAGTYIHLEHGKKAAAGKMASKAAEGLTSHKESVPLFIDAEVLVAKLNALDPVPPKLGAERFVAKKRNNSRKGSSCRVV